VDKRHRETRKVRWERLDEDLAYDAKALDRSVVVPSQIRTVLQTFRDALPELFPGRTMVPKTLIFAKDDSHAEDIVRLCRDVLGRGNEFCQKITYNAYVPGTTRRANTDNLIQEFRLSPQFRIAAGGSLPGAPEVAKSSADGSLSWLSSAPSLSSAGDSWLSMSRS
jgi:type I restriction enzyme R subunit